MERTTAYRHGSQLLLDRQDPEDAEVMVELLPGTRLERSAYGELRFYHRHQPFGQSLQTAVQLGWCRVLEDEEENGDSSVPSSCTPSS